MSGFGVNQDLARSRRTAPMKHPATAEDYFALKLKSELRVCAKPIDQDFDVSVQNV